MRLQDNDQKGKRVVLTEQERNDLLGYYSDDMEKSIALSIMAEAGCRSQEALDVTPNDVRSLDTEDGREAFKLRVMEGKGDQYRETPIPNRLAYKIQGFASSNRSDDEPLISVNRRTLQRWVQRAAESMQEQSGDDGWGYVSSHDLRRTWANLALEAESVTSPTAIMQAGGWNDFQTFRDHYMDDHGDRFMADQFASLA